MTTRFSIIGLRNVYTDEELIALSSEEYNRHADANCREIVVWNVLTICVLLASCLFLCALVFTK